MVGGVEGVGVEVFSDWRRIRAHLCTTLGSFEPEGITSINLCTTQRPCKPEGGTAAGGIFERVRPIRLIHRRRCAACGAWCACGRRGAARWLGGGYRGGVSQRSVHSRRQALSRGVWSVCCPVSCAVVCSPPPIGSKNVRSTRGRLKSWVGTRRWERNAGFTRQGKAPTAVSQCGDGTLQRCGGLT